MSTYKEKLLDPRWQKKRLEILQRDNFTCQLCKSKEKTLHVHHKKYISNMSPWEYNNDLLSTLCFECHEVEKENMEYQLDNLQDLASSLFLSGHLGILNFCFIKIQEQIDLYHRDPEIVLSSLKYFLSNDANVDSMIIDYEEHENKNAV